MSLLHIYNPIYARSLRVMDFFMSIFLSFYFTLLPFYYTQNTELVDIANERKIENRNKKINDFQATSKQVKKIKYFYLFNLIILIKLNHEIKKFFLKKIKNKLI